jgi:hypothetical protein
VAKVFVLAALAAALASAAFALSTFPAAAWSPSAGGTIVLSPSETLPGDIGEAPLAGAAANWKVVYLVGDTDGLGAATQESIGQARENAQRLRELGLQVVEFYPPDNHWADVKAAALDAHVLIYSGHGVYWDATQTLVGGFYLQANEFIHPDTVRAELHMRQGAIVIFNHACFSAGSSGADPAPISMEEAQRRVALYAEPFLEIGFGAYYASNYNDAPVDILRGLVEGKLLEQVYLEQPAFSPDLAVRSDHPRLSRFIMWVDVDVYQGQSQYNHAFVGLPELTAQDLFTPLTITPAASPFSVIVPVSDLQPRDVQIVLNANTELPAHWTAGTLIAPAWFSLNATQGLTGEPLSLTVSPLAGSQDACAEVLVASDDPRVANPSFTLPICLSLAKEVVRLPLARR